MDLVHVWFVVSSVYGLLNDGFFQVEFYDG